MITDRIKSIFQFIEFLHSNIENFKQYDDVINELYLLDQERQKVSLKDTFKDKLKYDEAQEQIEKKFDIIHNNIVKPIKAKANELNICDLNSVETLYSWNIKEIEKLKENFSEDDLPEIFCHKNKYLEYRFATKGEAFFGLGIFFNYLDKVLKHLFDFFKETEQNEFEAFEAFETKTIQVNDIGEAVKLIQHSFFNPSTIQQQTNIEALPFHPIQKGNKKNKFKTFPEYLLHPQREQLAELLKNEFKTEKGKGIRLMIEVLNKNNPSIMNYENRQRSAIFNAIKEYFNRDIGTYQSIFDYKYNPNNALSDYKNIENRIIFILKSLENNK